jgi:hypothetical protein
MVNVDRAQDAYCDVTLTMGIYTAFERSKSKYPKRQQKDGPRASPTLLPELFTRGPAGAPRTGLVDNCAEAHIQGIRTGIKPAAHWEGVSSATPLRLSHKGLRSC